MLKNIVFDNETKSDASIDGELVKTEEVSDQQVEFGRNVSVNSFQPNIIRNSESLDEEEDGEDETEEPIKKEESDEEKGEQEIE